MSSRIESQKAWLGLGGNIGDVQQAMADALQSLDAMDEIAVEQVSSVYKTPPWGLEDQPWFLNCCAGISCSLTPEQLLEACQQVERQGKRERIVRWGPRTIGVDILMFEGIEQIEQRLTIPHPRMHERAFVMVPLADIAPGLKVGNKTTNEWAESLLDERMEVIETEADWWKKQL